MDQRKLRIEIFNILFEYELMKDSILERKNEFLKKHKLSKSKSEFFENYIDAYLANEIEIIEKIKNALKSWTYELIGNVEKVLLKMSFFELYIKDEAHEIVINETMELAKMFGDDNTAKFINGILAGVVKELV